MLSRLFCRSFCRERHSEFCHIRHMSFSCVHSNKTSLVALLPAVWAMSADVGFTTLRWGNKIVMITFLILCHFVSLKRKKNHGVIAINLLFSSPHYQVLPFYHAFWAVEIDVRFVTYTHSMRYDNIKPCMSCCWAILSYWIMHLKIGCIMEEDVAVLAKQINIL